MNKETSSRVSSIAARLIDLTPEGLQQIINSEPEMGIVNFCNDVQTLAGSAMSQDETPGNLEQHPVDNFFTRLKRERKDLEDRLIALNSHLTNNPDHPNPRHALMLKEQARLMSELLAVLDERICDIQKTENTDGK